MESLGEYLKATCAFCLGGTRCPKTQVIAQIVIGTPGDVLDAISRSLLDISSLKYLILDELDDMYARGWHDEISAIIMYLPSPVHVGIYAATFPKEVEVLALRLFGDMYRISSQI